VTGGLGIGLAIAIGLTVAVLAALRSSSRRSGRVLYRGETYRRRADGSFVTAAGIVVTGVALIAALEAAWQDGSNASDDGASGGDGGGGGDGGD
jgi:uncharacterized membrane protein YidH (DUF202 family)